jgi:phage gpG-like protein
MSGEFLSVNVDTERAIARLKGVDSAMRAALLRVITRLSIEVQAKVKSEKLTGQVLHVRTGTLRRSINRQVIEDGESVFARVGTNVKYAHIHEYGFVGEELVREHVRRSQRQMAMAKFRTNKLGERIEVKGSYKKAGGGEGEILVRQHVRQMVMPERSFLRSTLAEMTPKIKADIKAAALSALR